MSLSNCRSQSACAESCCQWTRWKVKPSCWENWNLDNLGQISWMESLYFHSHLILFNSPILVHHASSCSDPAQVCPADLGDDELAGRVAVGWTWQWTVHRKIVDFPTKTSIYRGFSIAKLKNKSVYRCIYCIFLYFLTRSHVLVRLFHQCRLSALPRLDFAAPAFPQPARASCVARVGEWRRMIAA